MALEARATNTRILRKTSDSLEITVYLDGTPTNATSGDVTVTVTNEDGTAHASGTATNPGAGVYRFGGITTTNLNLLEAEWVGTWTTSQTFVTQHEIVGMHLFTEKQARDFDQGTLTDPPYSDQSIRDYRDMITDRLQDTTGVSWIPRYARVYMDGTGEAELWLPFSHPHEILEVVVDDEDYSDLDNLALYHYGKVIRKDDTVWAKGSRNIEIRLEHGHDRIVDGVDFIALKWLRHLLVPSNIPDTVTSYTDETGNLYRRGRGHTGLPEVDNWIDHHDHSLPLIA